MGGRGGVRKVMHLDWDQKHDGYLLYFREHVTVQTVYKYSPNVRN